MSLKTLALSLKLPEDSSQDVVFGAVAKCVAEGRAAVASLAALTSELPKFGLKLEGTALSRVESLSLDLTPKEGDDPEKVELKKRLAAAEQVTNLTAVQAIKERVAKLGLSMKVPPAMLPTIEQLALVRGEMESLMLSKDGKGVELTKSKDFGNQLLTTLEKLSSFSGVKFPTADPKTELLSDEQAASKERERVADEMARRQGGVKEEVLATK